MVERNGRTSYADMVTLNRMEQMVNNLSTRSQAFFKQFMDPRRSIEDECGFPEDIRSLTPENYRDMYDRNSYASRVVEVWPKLSWQTVPELFEDEDPEISTDFEEAWDEACKLLRGEYSWLNSDEGNPVWKLLSRADELSGISSFGAILLGFDDGEDLHEPVKTMKRGDGDDKSRAKFDPGKGGRVKLLYARALSEPLVQVLERETDRSNPRFSLPTFYNVRLESYDDGVNHVGTLPATIDFSRVHWSRVVHVADTWHMACESDIFAVPRQRAVWDHLLSIRKVVYGDAEAYWKNVLLKIFFETHPQLGGDVKVDDSALRDMMESMGNGLQGWGALMGMTAKSVAPSVVDPTSHVDIHVDAICIKMGLPKRRFVGSQPGSMGGKGDADSADDNTDDVIRHRQDRYVTPGLIGPFVDRLISVGVLPVPEDGYRVRWPNLKEQDALKQAQISLTKTQGLVAYIQGGVENFISPMRYLTDYQNMTDDEAQQTLEETTTHQEEIHPDSEEDLIPGHVPEPPAPEIPEGFGSGPGQETFVDETVIAPTEEEEPLVVKNARPKKQRTRKEPNETT